jgi:polar amino acid transport system permease protein
MLDRIVQELPQFLSYYNVIFLLKALGATFALSVIGCAAGFVAGFAIAMLRLTRSGVLAPARFLAVTVVEFFRRTPVLVILFLVFFFFNVTRIDLPLFTVALIAMFFVAAAYIAEIVRGGFESVHATQWQAAQAMNFSFAQTMYYVVVPQSWKVIIPPVFSFFLLYIKETALVSQLGVLELTYAGKVLTNKGFSSFLVFGVVLILYFLMSYPLTRFGYWMEKRLATR